LSFFTIATAKTEESIQTNSGLSQAPPMPPHIAALVEQLETGNRWRATMYAQTMHVQKPHWLDYDPVALAVLVIGIGIIELLALII
jgi:hypothetical protein